MNFLAGMMLVVSEGDEEEAFWMFAHMMSLIPSFHVGSLEGVQVCSATLH